MTKQQAFGVDISNFAGDLSPTGLQGLVDNGVRFCIVGYQDEALFERQVRALASVGIKVGCYFFIYWSRIAGESSRLALVLDHMRRIEETGVRFGWSRPDGTLMPRLWLDFEEDTTGTPATLPVADTVRWAKALALQVEASPSNYGIYTREDWWKTHTGNDTSFRLKPLWHASQFTQTVPVPFGGYYKGHEYGGWPVPMAWQFRGTGIVGGVSCDGDLEEWEAVAPPPAHAVVIVQEADGRQRVFVEQP